jgi:hypothetical protein
MNQTLAEQLAALIDRYSLVEVLDRLEDICSQMGLDAVAEKLREAIDLTS